MNVYIVVVTPSGGPKMEIKHGAWLSLTQVEEVVDKMADDDAARASRGGRKTRVVYAKSGRRGLPTWTIEKYVGPAERGQVEWIKIRHYRLLSMPVYGDVITALGELARG